MLYLPRNFPNFSKEMIVSTKSVLHVKHSQIIEVGTGEICGRGKLSGDPV